MELRVRREMKELSSVLAMSEEFCRLNEVDGANRNGVDFVLEELFTNAVKHCPEREDELLILLDRLPGDVSLSLTDFDADRFDIREATETDINKPLEERTLRRCSRSVAWRS